MSLFPYTTFTSVMALVALAMVLLAVGVRLANGPEVRAGLAGPARWLAWLVAASSTVGSLLYSDYFHLPPCLLCWYQRIAMYPLAIILLVGALRRDWRVRLYALPLSIIGFLISLWHVLIQNVAGLSAGVACDPSVPCTAKLVDRFGFVSIPFMAGAGFLLITVLLAFFPGSPEPARGE